MNIKDTFLIIGCVLTGLALAGVGSAAYLPPGTDQSTGATNIVEYAHHEIHGGSSYMVGSYDPDLDNGEKIIVAFKTPNTTKWLHLLILVDNSSESTLELLEAPTITNDTGTDLVVYNRNRNSGNTSGALNIKASPAAGFATLGPTITATGTVIEAQMVGSGKEKVGGETRGTSEFVLKQNTIYAIRLTALADNGSANVLLDWYEHTNK
ncbi:MAG: hypothetical protein GY861_18405 [bacterium]|nr:hypothetical protein [bacterium]